VNRPLAVAERAQKVSDRMSRKGLLRTPQQGRALNRAWSKAEEAFDRWAEQEDAFKRLRLALRLFTPEGTLNTRAQAEAEVRLALAKPTGSDWAQAQRLLGPEAFTFLDQVHAQLAALPVLPELRQAALRVIGLRQRPDALAGERRRAAALRGVLLAGKLVLSLAGEAGAQALCLVEGVLSGNWRSSSLVEGLNSVLRMQQARQKRLTQSLVDLKRLYWNMHPFRAGKRKGTTPYGRLGMKLPTNHWWKLIRSAPEQLCQQLSQLAHAA
jgi:hypothetical protein